MINYENLHNFVFYCIYNLLHSNMAKRIYKPNDMQLQENCNFNWESIIHNVTNGQYVLVLGSEVMLSRNIEEKAAGDSEKLIFNYFNESLAEKGFKYPCSNFNELSYSMKDIDSQIKRTISELDFEYNEIEPSLQKLMETKLFRVVLTTTFDPYALVLMENVWGKGNVRVMNINSLNGDEAADFDQYVIDDTANPLPPTLYYLFGKAFPKESSSRFVVTDNDAIETMSKWMSNDAPQRFLSYIRSKHMLALGCKFDDWLFRFFWYSLRGSINDFRKGEVAISLDKDSEVDRKLMNYFKSEKIHFLPDARDFMWQMNERLGEYNIKKEVLSKRKSKGVFISYAHEDFGIVSRIFFYLQKSGIDVWFDDKNLQSGDKYDMEIRDKIHSCKIFMPILSPQIQKDIIEGNERYYKDVEWNEAQAAMNINSDIATIPVRLVGYDVRSQICKEKLPDYMNVTVFDVEKSSLSELVNLINALLNK